MLNKENRAHSIIAFHFQFKLRQWFSSEEKTQLLLLAVRKTTREKLFIVDFCLNQFSVGIAASNVTLWCAPCNDLKRLIKICTFHFLWSIKLARFWFFLLIQLGSLFCFQSNTTSLRKLYTHHEHIIIIYFRLPTRFSPWSDPALWRENSTTTVSSKYFLCLHNAIAEAHYSTKKRILCDFQVNNYIDCVKYPATGFNFAARLFDWRNVTISPRKYGEHANHRERQKMLGKKWKWKGKSVSWTNIFIFHPHSLLHCFFFLVSSFKT